MERPETSDSLVPSSLGFNDADEPGVGWFEVDDSYRFGKKTFRPPHNFEKWDFLTHKNEPQFTVTTGTQETRFHRGEYYTQRPRTFCLQPSDTQASAGFRRRAQSAIGQDRARKEHEMAMEAKREEFGSRRRQRLAELDKTNGFNVMTGEYDPAKDKSGNKQRKHLDGKPGAILQREGDVLLRTSASRFYRPEPMTSAKRQHMLVTEGLPPSIKMSSVLGIGRAELPSYGVADNFAYSLYEPEQRARLGVGPEGLSRPATEALRHRPRTGASVGAGPGGSARPSTGVRPPRDSELRPTTLSRAGSARVLGGSSGNGAGGPPRAPSRGYSRGSGSRPRTGVSRAAREYAEDVASVRSLRD